MAGRPKRGIEFAGWDVDIFENDVKIDELIDAQGWIGFSIYFYLCQRAYASEGYFYKWSYANAATTARRMGGGIGSETVKQTVAVCLQIGLFDKRLFDLGDVLTSKGIQRRYAQAIQHRRCKSVIKKFWLLDSKETKGLGIIPENSDLPEADGDLLTANEDLLSANAPNSKVKDSKVNNTPLYPPRGNPTDEMPSAEKPVKKKPPSKTASELISEKGFGQKLEEATSDWVRYKIEKRQGYKATGLRNLLSQIENKAREFGEDPVVDVIRLSMSQNWQGIIWDRIRPMPSSAPKKQAREPTQNRFNNFPQREYDFGQMEAALLGKGDME